MNAAIKFGVGLSVLMLIGIAAILFDGVPGSVASGQRKLELRAIDALGPDASGWASVKMDGQKAILSGSAPDEDARDALLARIARADGAGGLIAGGVTTIDANDLSVVAAPPIADPFLFIAEHESGVFAFSGYVPDQNTKDAVYRLAEELFPATDISGELEIARGAPADAEIWKDAAETSLRALYYLRNGVVAVDGARFFLTGEAENDVRASAARMLISALPGGLTGEAHITATQNALATLPAQPAQDPTALAVQSQTAETCLQQLQQRAASLKIGFSSAQSEIDATSRDALRALASTLSACPNFRIAITGHTDSKGGGADNLQLSSDRAEAVRAFLAASGAPAAHLSARGAGEAEPIASNATEAGRQRNRRIEIEIISTGG